MPEPIVLYSTITKLALNIARIYYGDIHYVWCAPVFDASQTSGVEFILPPTSSPFEIYQELKRHVLRGDGHSDKIKENRAGILRGATEKLKAGKITAQQQQDIATTVEIAQSTLYEPLILVIPYTVAVRRLVTPVPVGRRANPLSAELIIPELPRRLFDVIRP